MNSKVDVIDVMKLVIWKKNYTCKPFKLVIALCSYNCHDFGHGEINYKKPKFDSNNRNSRIFRDTDPVGRRFEEGNNGSRNNIVCYKCNKFGHITINYKVPIS